MIAASIIVGRALQPLEGLIEGWRSFVQTCAAYSRVRNAMNSLRNEWPKLLLPRPEGRIDVERVLYLPPGSKEPVLNGVSFSLKPGEALAIVGPSGSGKSTLARILVGCIVPTAGKVRLDGTELRNWDRTQFGEYTGYLPQEVELFPGTITENICRMRQDLPDSAIYEAASSLASMRWCASCRTAMKPSLNAAARRSPEARGSGLHWRARFSASQLLSAG